MTSDPYTSRAAAGAPSTGLVLAKVPPEVLAKVGETFAAAAFDLQRQIGGLGAVARAERGAILRGMRDELARLEHFGIQVQQVARVLSGEGQAMVESFDIAAAARQTLTEWAAAAQRRGVRLEGPTEPMFVQAVPAVIEQLLDLALDYALRIGIRIEVGAALQGEPAQPMLTLHIDCAEAHGGGNDFDDLHWQLFALLARACSLSAQRLAAGRAVMLMLGFATRDAATPVAVRPAKLLERTVMSDGRHALLLEPRDPTRLQAHRLLQAAGLRVDSAGLGVGQIVRQVGADDDQRFVAAPEPFEHLRDRLRRRVADGQRQQRKIAEHRLQEGQLHFERVLLGVRGFADDDLRQVGNRRHRELIDRDYP